MWGIRHRARIKAKGECKTSTVTSTSNHLTDGTSIQRRIELLSYSALVSGYTSTLVSVYPQRSTNDFCARSHALILNWWGFNWTPLVSLLRQQLVAEWSEIYDYKYCLFALKPSFNSLVFNYSEGGQKIKARPPLHKRCKGEGKSYRISWPKKTNCQTGASSQQPPALEGGSNPGK